MKKRRIKPVFDRIDRTQRGLSLYIFDDANMVECSLQMSSLATDERIWLGVNRPTVHDAGPGHPPIDRTKEFDGLLVGSRMHLDRKQAGHLANILARFATTGEIFEP